MILDSIGKAVISFINISKQWRTKFGITFTVRKNNKKFMRPKELNKRLTYLKKIPNFKRSNIL